MFVDDEEARCRLGTTFLAAYVYVKAFSAFFMTVRHRGVCGMVVIPPLFKFVGPWRAPPQVDGHSLYSRLDVHPLRWCFVTTCTVTSLWRSKFVFLVSSDLYRVLT